MLTVQTNGVTSTALIKFWTSVTVTIHSHLNIHFLFKDSGLSFNHLESKTLHQGKANTFALQTEENRKIRPALGIKIYVQVC